VQVQTARVTGAAGAATLAGATGSSAVVTVEKPTGYATMTGLPGGVQAAAVYSRGSSSRVPVTADISSVFAGATVTMVGASYGVGAGVAKADGVSTVVGTGNDIGAVTAVLSAGASVVKGWTPDQAIMGEGAARDAAVVTADQPTAAATVAGVGTSIAAQIVTTTFKADGASTVTGASYAIIGGIQAGAVVSRGTSTVRMFTRTGLPPIKAKLRDGVMRRRMAQEQLSARDEAEILSILPHILDHIAAEEARRLQ
jgi:hypothetical protein